MLQSLKWLHSANGGCEVWHKAGCQRAKGARNSYVWRLKSPAMRLRCESISEYMTYQVFFAIFLVWKEYFSTKVAHSTVLHSLLIGTVMTPNYIDSNSLSVAPWCDCSNSGNDIHECEKFLNFFQDNICLSKYKIRYL